MNSAPTVVLGMPVYNRPDTLARALESLLSQTYRDFALVIVDDAPSPETEAIASAYVNGILPVTYERNPRRLGMVANWRRVFDRGRQLYPSARYFAWVSDHDVWHARWLEELVAVLERDPTVALAYCRNFRMTEYGGRLSEKQFETVGITDPEERLRLSARRMLAGDMVYGLMRTEALVAAGLFHRVILPDKQVLLALSLLGQVKQAPEVLWYREFLRGFDVTRQRRVLFGSRTPLYTYLPWHLQHATALFWDFIVRGNGRPHIGRMAAIRAVAIQLWESARRDFLAPKSNWRVAMTKFATGRLLVSMLPTATIRHASAATRPNADERAGALE